MAIGFVTATMVSNTRLFREDYTAHYDDRWGGADSNGNWNLLMGLFGLVLLVWDVRGKRSEGLGLTMSSWLCGAIFAVGLAVSRMVVRQKVSDRRWSALRVLRGMEPILGASSL